MKSMETPTKNLGFAMIVTDPSSSHWSLVNIEKQFSWESCNDSV